VAGTAGEARWVRRLALAVLAGLLLLPAGRAGAQESETVRLDGRGLFAVSAVESLDASERARRVEQRLRVLLRALDAVPQALVEASGDERVVVVSGVRVTTVYPIDAEDNLSDIDGLAALWARAIETGLQGGQSIRDKAAAETRAAVQRLLQTRFDRPRP